MEYAEDDFLLVSGIQHFVFCRRQWALIQNEAQWQDNEWRVAPGSSGAWIKILTCIDKIHRNEVASLYN